ncbi:MAG: metal ABC transporter substrate-binding protein, partial [Phototrophicales bacterium]
MTTFLRNILFLTCSIFVGCGAKDPNTLTVGVTAGPHSKIMQFIKDKAHNEGIKLTIVEFNDFILPNAALDQG